MNKIYAQFYKTPYGELILGSFQDKLCLCDWRYRKMRSSIDRRLQKGLDAAIVEGDTRIVGQAKKELEEYFNLTRTAFDVPLLMVGTDFQKSVWKELLRISFGTASTYLQLAAATGNKRAVRAVARANGANAISIMVPCHRIIGNNGSLVGYAGGLRAKQKLLDLEQNLFAC